MFEAMIGASFDPITNGHLWMIEQGFKRFELHLALAVNPRKKYTFSEKEREEMLSEALVGRFGKRAKEIRIHLIPDEYLAPFAEDKGVRLLLRGLRDADDFKYERRYRHANAKLAPNVDMLFLIPPLEIEAVSSSFVKDWIGPKGWEQQIVEFVPPPVYYALIAKFKGSYFCYGVGGKRGQGCGELLTTVERKRVIANHGGYCDKCDKQYSDFMASR